MEVIRAAQQLEAQLGVSVDPKHFIPSSRPSASAGMVSDAPRTPWGPRPAPPSWELDAAVNRLSETWADSQLAQAWAHLLTHSPLSPTHAHTRRARIHLGTTWAKEARGPT